MKLSKLHGTTCFPDSAPQVFFRLKLLKENRYTKRKTKNVKTPPRMFQALGTQPLPSAEF